MFAGSEFFGNFPVDDFGMATTAAPEKNGVTPGSKPTEKRPVTHLLLGHEGGRNHRIDDKYIHPGNVIGKQLAARRNVVKTGIQPHRKAIKQIPRPGLLEFDALPLPGQGEDKRSGEHGAQEQQTNPKSAPGADDGRGFVQDTVPIKCFA